jgi:hypothetical protein
MVKRIMSPRKASLVCHEAIAMERYDAVTGRRVRYEIWACPHFIYPIGRHGVQFGKRVLVERQVARK